MNAKDGTPEVAAVLGEWLAGRALPPIVRTLGIRLLSTGQGRAVAELPVRPELFNAMGTLHGGAFADLADVAIGAAVATVAEPGETFTTTDLSVRFFAPVRDGLLRAEAAVVRRGRASAYAECSLLDGEGALVAKASSSCSFRRSPA